MNWKIYVSYGISLMISGTIIAYFTVRDFIYQRNFPLDDGQLMLIISVLTLGGLVLVIYGGLIKLPPHLQMKVIEN